MKKKIYAVLGLGLFGASLARTLAEEGQDVIAIDKNMNHVEEVSDVVDSSIQADFTKLEQLKEAGVGASDVAVVATSQQLEDTIVAILNLKELRVPHIIVKSKSQAYQDVLLKVGADRVILPEIDTGIRIGKELSSPYVNDLVDLGSRNHISAFPVKEEWVGKDLATIDFRTLYGINIIAVKSLNEPYKVDLDGDYQLQAHDELLGVSSDDTLKQLFKNK